MIRSGWRIKSKSAGVRRHKAEGGGGGGGKGQRYFANRIPLTMPRIPLILDLLYSKSDARYPRDSL